MAVYVISGGATGIGAALSQQLRDAGHDTCIIDIKAADIVADLSTQTGCDAAISAVLARYPDGIDGLIPCAGLGPHIIPHNLVCRVNYFGAKRLVLGLQDSLQQRQGSVLIVSSNSASMPGLNPDFVGLLLADNEADACTLIDQLDGHNAYAGSKYALTCWMRKISPEYAKLGIQINAVAPGIIQTPLTEGVMADEVFGQMMRSFGDSVPTGAIGQPQQIADAMMFLLQENSRFIHGSVFFVDGGHDAMLRPNQF